jgi:hypothetical protein
MLETEVRQLLTEAHGIAAKLGFGPELARGNRCVSGYLMFRNTVFRYWVETYDIARVTRFEAVSTESVMQWYSALTDYRQAQVRQALEEFVTNPQESVEPRDFV